MTVYLPVDRVLAAQEASDLASLKSADLIWFVVSVDQIMDSSRHPEIKTEFQRVRGDAPAGLMQMID